MNSASTVFEMRVHRLPFGKYEAQVYTCGDPAAQPMVLLHGFMQDGRSWETVARRVSQHYFLMIPDFPGHGATIVPQEPEAFSLDTHCLLLDELFAAYARGLLFSNASRAKCEEGSESDQGISKDPGVKKTFVVGYSMGGRIAATYACQHAEAISALVLESAGLGPVSEKERLAQEHKNEALYRRLLEEPFDAFIEFWEQLPLFASQKHLSEETFCAQRTTREENDPDQLAYSLRYAGQHRMQNVRKPLGQGALPILYLAGGLDVTYTEIARCLVSDVGAKGAVEVEIIEGAGHNIHLEKPEEFCDRLCRYCAQKGKREQMHPLLNAQG